MAKQKPKSAAQLQHEMNAWVGQGSHIQTPYAHTQSKEYAENYSRKAHEASVKADVSGSRADHLAAADVQRIAMAQSFGSFALFHGNKVDEHMAKARAASHATKKSAAKLDREIAAVTGTGTWKTVKRR